MKKTAIKITVLATNLLLLTNVSFAQWSFSSAPDIIAPSGYDKITFPSSSSGLVRGFKGNTDNYVEMYANTNQNDGASLFLFGNSSATHSSVGNHPGSVRMISSGTNMGLHALEILNHPNSTTWTSIFRVKNNGDVATTGNIYGDQGIYTLTSRVYASATIDVDANVGRNVAVAGDIYGDHGIYTLDSRVYRDATIDANASVGNDLAVHGNVYGDNGIYTASSTVYGDAYVGNIMKIGHTSLTTPSGYRLYVEDGILTEKVRVALKDDPANWADYVFNEDYNLKSLLEIEKYIKKHKHLPEIPSTEEVHKEGLDLAQMDAKLLQKIEELTLYVIQQQKEIDALKKGMKK